MDLKKQLLSHQSSAVSLSGTWYLNVRCSGTHTHTHKHINNVSRHANIYSYVCFTLQVSLGVGQENSPVDVSYWLESCPTVKLEYLDVYVVANAVYAIFMTEPGIAYGPKELL